MLAIRLSDNPVSSEVWGSGHTIETDPTQRGWLCRKAWPMKPGCTHQVLMLGRRGVAGCATIIRCRDVLSGGAILDVAVYWETPEAVRDSVIQTGKNQHNAVYRQIPDVPGWGLEVIRLIEAERRTMVS